VKEYLATKAYTPAYHKRYVESLKTFDAIIVYNEIAKAHLAGIHANIHAIGGGVQLDEFPYAPMPDRAPGEKKVILMTGRSMDEAKGMKILDQAGERLWAKRQDFEIWVTHGDSAVNSAWLKDVGWQNHSGIVALYRQSDICVVPSVWEEPFGLVAVEAMATGRPVCVARVGGLQNIPRHGETGFVYDAKDSAKLAEHLDFLLENDEARRRMGEAARRQVEEEYTWDRVIETHYPPILEGIAR
jgi:glycosyltransferase involved in cell wall biosynthesis